MWKSCWVRKTGLEYLVDIHVEVDPALRVREGHAIAHAVKDRLLGYNPAIRDVLVHIEPAPVNASPSNNGSDAVPVRHRSANRHESVTV